MGEPVLRQSRNLVVAVRQGGNHGGLYTIIVKKLRCVLKRF